MYDARLIGELVSDTDTRVAAADLPDDPVLAELIASVSAEIFSALTVGDRYTPTQLASLTGEAADLLHCMCSDGILLRLKRRRGRFNAEKDGELQKSYDERIKAAKDGDAFLYLPDETQKNTIAIGGPTVVDRLATPNTFRDSPNQQYYPMRRKKTRYP